MGTPVRTDFMDFKYWVISLFVSLLEDSRGRFYFVYLFAPAGMTFLNGTRRYLHTYDKVVNLCLLR